MALVVGALAAAAFAQVAAADPPTVPDAPSITDVTLGHNAVVVAVAANGDGGDAITDFTVTCDSSDGGTTQSATDDSSPLTVTGLDNGKTYSCTAVATNGVGDSDPSDPTDDFVAATIPNAPSIDSVTPLTNNQVRVAFTPGSDGGDEVIFFKATCASSNGGTTKTKTGASSPLTVTSLSNNRTYTCTMTATNSIGVSAASAASGSFVAGTTPPTPTVSVARGDDSAVVTVTTANNGGSAITSYSASCTSSDGGDPQSASSGTSPVTVSGLTHGKTYTCTATATNTFGTSSSSVASSSFVAAVLPDAPTLTGVTRGSNSADVAFTANADGGDAITGFTATCTSSDGGTTKTGSHGSSPVTVSALSNGKTYSCTVVATNGVGNSSASSASSGFVAATVPDAPTVDSADRGDNAAVVAFTPGVSDGGDTVTGYTVTCASSDGGTTRTGSDTASPVTVHNLTNGKTYTCTVVATNAIGNSSASAASGAIVAAAVPDAPTIDTLTRDDNAAIVAFTPGVSDGGDTVTDFTVTCTSSDGGATETANDTDSPITVTTLTNSKTYTCNVYATNSIGNGAASTDSNPFVAATVPNAPSVSGVTRGPNSAAVAFSSNGNGGDTITAYTVTCESSDGGQTQDNTDTASPITVGSLDNGKTYSCTVVATNSFGDSAASAASSNFTAATIPDAPDITGTSVGSNAISLQVAPNDDGSAAITGYTASCVSSDGGDPSTGSHGSSPVTVSDLTNGKTYTCTVVATNAIGDSADSDPTAPFVAVGVAAAPMITAVDLDADSVIVDFDAGPDGGVSVDDFTVTCTSSDGGATQDATDTDSPITVDSLTHGKTYTCTVHATNVIGDSEESDPTGAFVAGTVPSAPSISSVTRGTNSAIVTISNNGNGGDTIHAYTVKCTSSNGGVSRSRTAETSPVTVSSLTNARTYTCKALAINGIGASPYSAASGSFVAATRPGAPTVTGVTRGLNAVDVAFSAPVSNGGAAISSYTATCASSDGGADATGSHGSSPVTVSGLTNGNTYTCTVHATNAIGDSLESADSSSFVAATKPNAPTIGAATPASPNSVSVSFTPGTDGSDTVTSFTATCTSSDGGTTRTGSGGSSPVTVATLTNAKTYTCTATATNTLGTSVASAATSSFVAATVPSAPTIGAATRGNGSASVAFTANGTGGHAITGFTVTCTSSDGGTTRTASGGSSPLSVASLTPAKTYTCTAVATNDLGNSSASAATGSFTAAATPAAPVITGVTRGQNSAIVAYTVNTNGDAITAALVTCTSSNLGVTKTGTGTTSPITVSALTNAKTYTCTMTATNTFGTSSASAASASFVAATVPGAPTIGTVTHASGNATVAFTAPASNGGSAITLYTATCTSTNGGATKSGTRTVSAITVSALTVGKLYTCKVKATNAIGDSALSGASASFTAT